MTRTTPSCEQPSYVAVVVLALFTACLLAVPAGATEATEVGSSPPDYSPRGSPGFIDVSADRSDNRITVAFDSNRPAYVIRDSERIVSGDCERLAARRSAARSTLKRRSTMSSMSPRVEAKTA